MDLMRETPDKRYTLAIVDPPYGIADKLLNGGHNGTVMFHEQYAKNKWDNKRPSKEYFKELMRISVNQVVWGANYFLDCLRPSRGVISWDKNLGSPYNFSHWEMAWTSFDCIARRVVEGSNTGGRIHPTQKPVALYRWLLANYAHKGDTIIDTHMGSGSIAIACHYAGYHLTATELDQDYFDSAVERIKHETSQKEFPLFDQPAADEVETMV